MDTFVIGTRGSRLALAQTELVAVRLREVLPGLSIRLQIIKTTGDRHPDLTIGELSGVGFFVKELELALLDGAIDAAVHSMKDLPSGETPELRIAAMPERDDPRDVLVAREARTLQTLPAGARIGTSSARRAAALLAMRPDLQIMPIRGNVETRIRKVDAGEFDAVCLAAAGLRRAGLHHRITEWFAVDVMVPAPGQGALGVQVGEHDRRAREIAGAIDHLPTHTAVLAERIVLQRLEAGCRLPLGAYASVNGAQLSLRAAVMSPDGRRRFDVERTGSLDEWRGIAKHAAEDLLVEGAGLLAQAGEQR